MKNKIFILGILTCNTHHKYKIDIFVNSDTLVKNAEMYYRRL